MGCDGGTIPRRDEMVKLKKKAEKADKDVELAAKWKHCALTAEELKRPVVACELGMLYNKEALLLALLDKANLPDLAKHIRSLKDVVELKLTLNPVYKAVATAEGYSDAQSSKYVCPVTGLEMTGRHRFAYLRGCGCVFSEKALKEVPSELCHKCGSPFTAADIVIINGTEEDFKRQNETMIERRVLAKQAKLAKKKRKTDPTLAGGSSSNSSESNGSASSSEERESPPVEKKQKLDSSATNGDIQQPSSSDSGHSEQQKVKSESGATANKRGTSISQRLTKLQSSSKVSDSKLRSGSSVASVTKKATKVISSNFKRASEDASARKVYKSLFHSADSQRPKERTSNWVTYNPYH